MHTLGGGQVKTVTVSMPSSTSDADAAVSTTSSGSHMKGGTIAGIVVGTIGGCAAILAVIFVLFIMRRRKRANSPDPSVQNGLIDGGRSPQMGMFSDNHSHTLSAGSSNANRLQTTFTDDRMKPNPIYPNGERGSSVSLQDNEDYSRPVLRVSPTERTRMKTLTSLAYKPRLTPRNPFSFMSISLPVFDSCGSANSDYDTQLRHCISLFH